MARTRARGAIGGTMAAGCAWILALPLFARFLRRRLAIALDGNRTAFAILQLPGAHFPGRSLGRLGNAARTAKFTS
jgi:hypothetical protein